MCVCVCVCLYLYLFVSISVALLSVAHSHYIDLVTCNCCIQSFLLLVWYQLAEESLCWGPTCWMILQIFPLRRMTVMISQVTVRIILKMTSVNGISSQVCMCLQMLENSEMEVVLLYILKLLYCSCSVTHHCFWKHLVNGVLLPLSLPTPSASKEYRSA